MNYFLWVLMSVAAAQLFDVSALQDIREAADGLVEKIDTVQENITELLAALETIQAEQQEAIAGMLQGPVETLTDTLNSIASMNLWVVIMTVFNLAGIIIALVVLFTVLQNQRKEAKKVKEVREEIVQRHDIPLTAERLVAHSMRSTGYCSPSMIPEHLRDEKLVLDEREMQRRQNPAVQKSRALAFQVVSDNTSLDIEN